MYHASILSMRQILDCAVSEGILSNTLQRRWPGKRNCHGFVKSAAFAARTDLS
jgi:hypothetical protein